MAVMAIRPAPVLDNTKIIEKIKNYLLDAGLHHTPGCFWDQRLGRYTLNIDVGSSYGEILVRVQIERRQVARFAIVNENQVDEVLGEVHRYIDLERDAERRLGSRPRTAEK